MPKFSPAPVNSPIISKDQSLMLWFRELGNLLDKLTAPAQMTNKDSAGTDQSLNYVAAGATTTVTYKGKGDVVIALPSPCRYDSFLSVSNGSFVLLDAGAKAVTLPDYGATAVIIQGTYINA